MEQFGTPAGDPDHKVKKARRCVHEDIVDTVIQIYNGHIVNNLIQTYILFHN